MSYSYTTQAQVRAAFWREHENVLPRKRTVVINGDRFPARQNDQPAETRAAFVDYVDALARNGEISEALASRVTL